MSTPEFINSDEFYTPREHDVRMSGGFDSLYSESSERSTRKSAVTAPIAEDDPLPGAYWETPAAAEPLPEIIAVNELVSEAHAELAEAKAQGEEYSVADASREEVIAMLHAVTSTYGEEVAKSAGTDPKKLGIARVQLNDALTEKMKHPDGVGEGEEVVDSATFILTAVSLARMRQETSDSAEKILAEEALGSLRDAGDLERIKHQEEIGHHTGEIAIAAIMGYEQVAV